jgi:hypothetical protein
MADRSLGKAAEAEVKTHKRNRDEEERDRPQGVFQDVAEEVRRDHRIPGAAFRDHDHRHDGLRDIHGRIRMRDPRQFAQHHRPLDNEAQFRDRRDRAADEDAREPGVEQANYLDIGPRQDRAKGAAEHINGAKQQQRLERVRDVTSAEEIAPVAAAQSQQEDDVEGAGGDQKTPPIRDRVRPIQPV